MVMLLFSFPNVSYPCEIAPTGQLDSHEPQSRQLSASISYFPLPLEIAPIGQFDSQLPQEIQSSEITYAIIPLSFRIPRFCRHRVMTTKT